MSEEANSRNTVPDLRWAETTLEVPLTSADLVEPSSGAKDLGWVATQNPNRQWWNWFFWGVGVTFRHIARSWNLLWQREMVMPGADTSGAVVTAGTGLSVDVTEGSVWINGGWYTVPAANDLALSAAHATLDRIDLVVARLNSGTPEYYVVTGTPGLVPSAPATPASNVKIAEVAVDATVVVPGTITDVREFGVMEVDTVEANDRLGAGYAAGEWLLRVYSATSMWIGAAASPLLSVSAGVLYVKPSTFAFSSPVVRKVALGPASFTRAYTFGGGDVELDNMDINYNTLEITNTEVFLAPVVLPKGATVTAARLWVRRTDDDDDVYLEVASAPKASHTGGAAFGSANFGTGGGETGNLAIEADGLSEVVDEANYYFLSARAVVASMSGTLQVLGAEVEYTETFPFVTA